MPILEVTVVLREGEMLSTGITAALADAAGVVFDSEPGQTWVLLSTVDAAAYAENGGVPDGVSPVFVKVLKARHPDGEAMDKEVERLAAVVAATTGRPLENVHLIYEPEAKRRIAFGGRLLSD